MDFDPEAADSDPATLPVEARNAVLPPIPER